MTIGDIIEICLAAIIVSWLSFTSINQKSRIQEWLVFAVTNSEKELGAKTGQLKLRLVYEWFNEKFPIVSAMIPFSLFSKWVSNALDTMKIMKESNSKVAAYIDSKNKPTEVKLSDEATLATSIVAAMKEDIKNENSL